MNILIVSRNNFFISGTIALVSQTLSGNINPVFMVSEDENAPLEPDIIIHDLCIPPVTSLSSPGLLRARILTNKTPLELVKILFTKQCGERNQVHCPLHHFYLEKRDAAKGLVMLLQRAYTTLLSDSIQYCYEGSLPLSKQQAMVVKYTSEGMSLTDISRATQLSVKTISTHKRAVMRKLGIKNNSEFYQFALAGYVNSLA